MRGPIDFIVVGFEGNKFDGSILRALSDAIEKGVIGLVALVVIRKDEDGTVMVADVDDLGYEGDADADKYISYITGPSMLNDETSKQMIDRADIEEVGDLLENNTAAGLLVIEHLWAKPLKQAIINANGVLVAEGRIHPEAAVELAE